MNGLEFITAASDRLMYNEGVKLSMYIDSLGNRSGGVGFNYERADAVHALETCGVTTPYAVISGAVPLTMEQCRELLEYSIAPIIDQARSSLQPMHYDLMSDARRLAVFDLVYNLGLAGWMDFSGTRALLDDAVHTIVRLKNPTLGHQLFGQAAQHLRESDYAKQVGDRALRNAEMIESSVLVPIDKTYPAVAA